MTQLLIKKDPSLRIIEKVVYSLIHARFKRIEAQTVGSESELSLHSESVGWIQ